MKVQQLVFATNNVHKLEEVSHILGDNFKLLTLNQLGFYDEIPEDFETLEENALQKARHINRLFSVSCFADDTGLEVEALSWEPGVRSARYAGNHRNSLDNINKLLSNLNGVANRNARFRTVIALVMDGREHLFEGVVEGSIIDELKGSSGFGYDPVFLPKGYHQTFAQMPLELKNRISHRGIAISKLNAFLQRSG